MRGLFDDPEEEEVEPTREPGEDPRCTPEILLGFIRETRAREGRLPTLKECKQRFGGILGPMVDFWELKRRGLV